VVSASALFPGLVTLGAVFIVVFRKASASASVVTLPWTFVVSGCLVCGILVATVSSVFLTLRESCCLAALRLC
jgi:hypothetical protein